MDTARLTIIRKPRMVDLFRAYCIFINGAEVGRLRRGGRMTHETPPGWITVQARIDWCESKPLVLTLKPGDDVALTVVNTFGAWQSNHAITAGADDYLTLAVVGPDQP